MKSKTDNTSGMYWCRLSSVAGTSCKPFVNSEHFLQWYSSRKNEYTVLETNVNMRRMYG